jgi:steroid 5-alpha reductase family enzyme
MNMDLPSIVHIAAIFAAFALIHSITVTMWFKELCRRAFGDTFMRVWYRFLYTCVSGITTFIAVYFIRHVPDQVLWQGPLWLRLIMNAIQIAGIVFGVRTFQYLDKWEFMGFRQVWRYLARNEVAGSIEGLAQKELVTTGVYGIVRHPLYVAGIIIFTFSPHITVNGLTITVLADLYFLFGMFIEERRFLRIFGEQYREYMKKVPRMVPRIFSPQRTQRKGGAS